MARSQRFRELQKRLTELRRHLLPRTSLTGAYTARQYDRVRAFRLLAHAEIEACVEDLVFKVATESFQRWKLDSRPRTCLVALVAYYEGSFPPTPTSILQPSQNPTLDLLEARIERAKNHYCNQIIRNNHGIREHDLLSMFFPVGITDTDLDNAWLATVDSFGQTRGETAHRAGRTQQPPDPVDERDTVDQIVAGLGVVDARLTALLND
jgi:RiboL-PSP-HEPN